MKHTRTRILSLALALLLCLGLTPTAVWAAEENPINHITLDSVRGDCELEVMTADQNGKLNGTLPTPTKLGFTFDGWYWDGQRVDDNTAFIAVGTGDILLEAKWVNEKITPTVSAAPTEIKAGVEQVQVKISCTTPDVALNWRPLEYTIYGGDGNLSKYIGSNAENVGLKLTKVEETGTWYQDTNESFYPRDLYPDGGIHPTTELTLTFEGKAVPGYLVIGLQPSLFVQLVKDPHRNLEFSSEDRFESVTFQIPVEDSNTCTVKFDLNGIKGDYFPPEDITVNKGDFIRKLPTPELPKDQEFYGWGYLITVNGKEQLAKWDEKDTVDSDITLYLIRNKVEEEKPTPPTTPTTPPATPNEPASFTDVEANRWFKSYVDKVTAAGLMSGMGDGKFEPQANLAVSQALVLAYQIDSKATGKTLPEASGAWYMPYYQYCLDNGIITADQVKSSDLTRMATRFEMVSILDKAVPEKRMEAVKTVTAIPDLKEDAAYGDIVYKWYRAGIVSGDAEGRFNGANNITRAEVAVILCQINEL